MRETSPPYQLRLSNNHPTCSRTPIRTSPQPAFIIPLLFIVQPKKSRTKPDAMQTDGGLLATISTNMSRAMLSPSRRWSLSGLKLEKLKSRRRLLCYCRIMRQTMKLVSASRVFSQFSVLFILASIGLARSDKYLSPINTFMSTLRYFLGRNLTEKGGICRRHLPLSWVQIPANP